METELEHKNEERIVNLQLTERDLFLVEWSLDKMARESLIRSLRLEIDQLRLKLVMKNSYQRN